MSVDYEDVFDAYSTLNKQSNLNYILYPFPKLNLVPVDYLHHQPATPVQYSNRD